jgi:hypothetical protein
MVSWCAKSSRAKCNSRNFVARKFSGEHSVNSQAFEADFSAIRGSFAPHTLFVVKPGILASARKHGIADEDMLHALRNAIIEVLDDDIVMIVGPNRHGNLIEVAIIKSGNNYLIIHAMQAREKYLR